VERKIAATRRVGQVGSTKTKAPIAADKVLIRSAVRAAIQASREPEKTADGRTRLLARTALDP